MRRYFSVNVFVVDEKKGTVSFLFFSFLIASVSVSFFLFFFFSQSIHSTGSQGGKKPDGQKQKNLNKI